MKKTLFALTLVAFAGNAAAQDSVTFNINGRILPKTCAASIQGGDTITMTDKFVDNFTGANQTVDGGATGTFRIVCPATTNIDMKVQDALSLNSSQAYLSSNGTARNVGVKVEFLKGGSPIAAVNGKNLNTTNRLYAGTGTNYSTNTNLDFTIKPSYFSTAAGVTPGTVTSQAKLTFSYP